MNVLPQTIAILHSTSDHIAMSMKIQVMSGFDRKSEKRYCSRSEDMIVTLHEVRIC